MPAATKSFWPALAGFIAFSFTYTAVVARNEGGAIDAARSRWQNQKMRGDQAMTAAGTQWLEEHKH